MPSLWPRRVQSRVRSSVVPLMPPVAVWVMSMWVTFSVVADGSGADGVVVCSWRAGEGSVGAVEVEVEVEESSFASAVY